MDDFFEVLVFWFLLPILVIIMIIGVIQMASSEDGFRQERQDKRYELCLKQHKDWVDGNCVTPVK